MTVAMSITLACFALFSASSAGPPSERRSINTVAVTAKFDDISNGFPISSPYVNLNWAGFFVSSPDRGQPSYVKYTSPFQYARLVNGSTGNILTSESTPDFLISSLRYGCSARSSNDINPGPPKACTITVHEECINSAHSRTLTAHYSPSQPIAPMQTLNLVKGRTCTKGSSYTIKGSGPDVLLDGIMFVENHHS